MTKNPIPCGGFDYDANTLRFIERDGRPTLNEDHSGIIQLQATNNPTSGVASHVELMNSDTTQGGNVVITYWYVK